MEGPLSSEDQSFGLSESVDFVYFLRISLPRVQVKRLIDRSMRRVDLFNRVLDSLMLSSMKW